MAQKNASQKVHNVQGGGTGKGSKSSTTSKPGSVKPPAKS